MREHSMLLMTLRVVSSFTAGAWLLHETYESTKPSDEPCPGGIHSAILALISMYSVFDVTAHYAAPKIHRLYRFWQERKKEKEREPLKLLLQDFESLSQEQKQTLLSKNYAQYDGNDIVPLYYCKYINFEIIQHPVGVKVLAEGGEKIEIAERETMETLIDLYNKSSKQDFFRLPGKQTIISVDNDSTFVDKNKILIDNDEIKQEYCDYLVTLQQEIDTLKQVRRIDIRPKIQ